MNCSGGGWLSAAGPLKQAAAATANGGMEPDKSQKDTEGTVKRHYWTQESDSAGIIIIIDRAESGGSSPAGLLSIAIKGSNGKKRSGRSIKEGRERS